MPVQVAVCGPAEAGSDDLAAAREVGRGLAERGVVVLCGGGGGVMAAAAEGAAVAGGLAVGVWSGRDRTGTSPYLAVVVATGLGQARNAVLVQSADAVVVVGGSWGTLSELAHAMRRGVRVVSLRGWTVLDGDGRPAPGVEHVATPAEAVERALAGPDAPVASTAGGGPRD